MPERYCFVCDSAVEGDVCSTCGTKTWVPTDEPAPTRTDEHLREIAAQAQPAGVEPPTEPPVPAPAPPPPTRPTMPAPEIEDRRIARIKTPGRWAPIAAVVVAGIVLMSVLAGPSGNAPEEETIETPTITGQTTTTVPSPGSTRGLWSPADGTWVGGFTLSPNRPDLLIGPSMTPELLDIPPETIVIDALPDGRLVTQDAESGEVLLIGDTTSGPEPNPLPVAGSDSMLPRLSPNGTRLALVDGNGAPHVWQIGAEFAISTADSVSTAVQAISSFSWSPDSTVLALNTYQGSYYIWDLDSNGVGSPLPGRAIAITRGLVAAWGVEGLELRDHEGRVLRRWTDLTPAEDRLRFEEGAFDPLQRYLVVRGSVGPPDEDAEDGLTVLSTIGTTRRLLTAEPGESFAWSGDGSGLYWLDSRGFHAWSADPELASTTLVESTDYQSLSRLRVYDNALLPVRPQVLATDSLIERYQETAYLRAVDGLHALDDQEQLAAITPAGISGYKLAVAKGETDLPVILAGHVDDSRHILGVLNALQLPEGARLVKAIALTPDDQTLSPSELEATRWYLETDTGLILHGPEAGVFTTAAEGSSLNLLGGTAFHVTADGSAVQTIPVGEGIDTVLSAENLDAERILAVGTLRRALFVLASTSDGETQLWQVPADSDRLSTPLFPPAPAMTAGAWVVHTFPEGASNGRILTDPDTGPSGELLAVQVPTAEGPVTTTIAAPLALESVCGATAGGACALFTVPGTPLGFSPDGNWLLVGNGDGYTAFSTVGRGSVEFPDPAPDDVAWVEAAPSS